MTLLLTHPACLDHVTPPGHPERPDRLRAVAEVLAEERFKPLSRGEAPEGSLDSVTLCHGEHYVGELRHISPQSGMIYIDGDTSMSPGTWEAVMRGVGGAVAATDAVMSGTHQNAFVEADWPKASKDDLLEVTFKEANIDHDRHPSLLRLIGAKQDLT